MQLLCDVGVQVWADEMHDFSDIAEHDGHQHSKRFLTLNALKHFWPA
jgi:hypothetical protein